jgi:hypothetical protein
MRKSLFIAGIAGAVVIASAIAVPSGVLSASTAIQQRGAGGRGTTGQAKPRPPQPTPSPKPSKPPSPPPRVLPPGIWMPPHHYDFPPLSLQRGFYYHPYFGFYFGPYYGPYYPYPGPFAGGPYAMTSLRLRVKPPETQVYINGYFAGIVDDFDGVFQRLYLPPGNQELELYLPGYATFSQDLYLQPGMSRELVHQMVPLGPGETSRPPRPARAARERLAPSAAAGSDRPASPFGVLYLQVEPADAQVLIDGEIWLRTEQQRALVVHIPKGRHALEVRKDGYTPFRTQIELSEGSVTRLGVTLQPERLGAGAGGE